MIWPRGISKKGERRNKLERVVSWRPEKRPAPNIAPVTADSLSGMRTEIILLDLTMWMSFGDLIKSHFYGEARMMGVVVETHWWQKHTDDNSTRKARVHGGLFCFKMGKVCVCLHLDGKDPGGGKGWRFKKAIMIPLLTSQRVISLEFRSRVQYTELCKCTSIIKAWELSNQRSIYWIVNLGNSTLYGLYGWLILEAFWVTSMEYVGMKKWLKSLSSPHSYLIPGALHSRSVNCIWMEDIDRADIYDSEFQIPDLCLRP